MKAWIEEDNINYEYIIRYLRDTMPESTGHIAEMEAFAKDNEVPISRPECIRLVEVLLKIKGARKVLELGTAIGYSAIRMTKACGAEVVTVEISEEMAEIARKNFQRAGVCDRVELIHGDAREVIRNIQGEEMFDVIFVDAAKGHYMEFFTECQRLLKKGGILISDNVLYKGMTATDELVVRRKITIVRRLRKYLEMLKNNKDFSTALLPVGDGIAISFKE